MKSVLILFFFLMFQPSCSLILPDTPETPDPSIVSNDEPFNFKSIVDNSNNIEFDYKNYRDYFDENFHYYDYNNLGDESSESEFLTRLYYIKQDSISVTWKRKDETQTDPSLLSTDKDVQLQLRTYSISVVKSGFPTEVYSGEAEITLHYSTSEKRWIIIKWLDRSTNPNSPSGNSYFNPNFN